MLEMSIYKTIIYYECIFTFFCIILSLILFSIIICYGQLNKLRSQMKLKFTILFLSFIVELPYYLYLLPKEFDDTPISAMYIYWLGVLKLLSYCVVPTAVILLVVDRISIILYPTNIYIQRTLFRLSIVVVLCQTVLLTSLSIVMEKPEKEETSKLTSIFYFKDHQYHFFLFKLTCFNNITSPCFFSVHQSLFCSLAN